MIRVPRSDRGWSTLWRLMQTSPTRRSRCSPDAEIPDRSHLKTDFRFLAARQMIAWQSCLRGPREASELHRHRQSDAPRMEWRSHSPTGRRTRCAGRCSAGSIALPRAAVSVRVLPRSPTCGQFRPANSDRSQIVSARRAPQTGRRRVRDATTNLQFRRSRNFHPPDLEDDFDQAFHPSSSSPRCAGSIWSQRSCPESGVYSTNWKTSDAGRPLPRERWSPGSPRPESARWLRHR